MPHVFLNRERQHGLRGGKLDIKSQHFWEIFPNVAYIVGSILFIVGSVLFLPDYASYAQQASICFIVGAVLFLMVSFHEGIEVIVHERKAKKVEWRDYLDETAAVGYAVGSIFYIIGSFLYLPGVGRYTAGAWNFVAGSAFLMLGAVGNALQIFESPNKGSAAWAQLLAVCYIEGGTLFLTASVPYSYTFESVEDEDLIDRWNAIQYIVGSIFYLLGSLLNVKRATVVADFYAKKKEKEGEEE